MSATSLYVQFAEQGEDSDSPDVGETGKGSLVILSMGKEMGDSLSSPSRPCS